jgi:hypothetical protein
MLIKNIVNDLASSIADLVSVPDHTLACILRKRGWIVFQLDEDYRKCNSEICLMHSYTEQCEKLEAIPITEIKL